MELTYEEYYGDDFFRLKRVEETFVGHHSSVPGEGLCGRCGADFILQIQNQKSG